MPYQFAPADQGSFPNFLYSGIIGGADISVNSSSVFVDIATLGTVPAGVYLCWGKVQILQATNISLITAKIWDGTNVFQATEQAVAVSGQSGVHVGQFILTLLAAATVKLSAVSSNTTTTTAKLAAADAGTGTSGLVTGIWAIRLA